MKIEIWSDIICPFCYLGKKKLERAIENVGLKDNVEIIWRSFQLDPEFPSDKAVPSIQYLVERKGYPIQQINQIQKDLVERSLPYGIDFQFDKSLTFNSLKAHQLLHWSKKFGKSDQLKEVLLKAYFTEGLDLSKDEVLAEQVVKVVLSQNEALEVILTKEFLDEVDSDCYQATQIGVRGVPFFLINNRTSISGAQEDQVFEQLLKTEMIQSGIALKSASEGLCSLEEGCD